MPARHPRMLTVSPKELLVLDLLVREQSLYGLQLVTASRGRLKRGTVYVKLGRMEEKGYISSRQEDAPPLSGGMPRRVYEPTALGRRMHAAFRSGVKVLTPEVAQ